MTEKKATTKTKAMIVAGVMSGTSADGVDVAICRVSPGAEGVPRVKVLGHKGFAYDPKMRRALLSAMDAKAISAAELARLSWRLGEQYADCVEAAARELKLKPQLVACHGQTIYHQGSAKRYLGAPVRCTWQMGEASVIAERLRVAVVSDFRPADMAAGGNGAPLVPMLDFCLFRHAKKNRVLLNLGGIANVTALPAGCGPGDVLAFDTGPANMVVDAVVQKLFDFPFDRNGEIASRGHVLSSVLTKLMQGKYFSAPPPKSCGREEFGREFVADFLRRCRGANPEDMVATATALTSATVLHAYSQFCAHYFEQHGTAARATEVFVAGGGARNRALMRLLKEGLKQLDVSLATTESLGLATDAKEAAAFALLGWLTWHGLPGNLPSATGARRPVVLGKVTYGG